jgi:hypothetical protein
MYPVNLMVSVVPASFLMIGAVVLMTLVLMMTLVLPLFVISTLSIAVAGGCC